MTNRGYARESAALCARDEKNRVQSAFCLYCLYFVYFLLPVCTQIVPQVVRYALYFLVPAYALYINVDIHKQLRMTRSTFQFLAYTCIFIGAFYYTKWKDSRSFSEYFFTVFFFWLPLLLFENVIDLPPQAKKKLKSLFWCNAFITMITTIIGNIQFPEASRDLASYTPLADMYRSHNVGDYHFVYGVSILIPYILYEIRNSKRKKKAFFMCVLVAAFSLAVVTQYAIAIIMCIVETVIVIILKAKDRSTMIIKCLVLFGIAYLIKDSIPSWLLSLKTMFEEADAASLAARCTMLAKFFQGEGATGDMANRGDLYLASWKAFCDSPLLGNLVGAKSTVGGHSEILDILGSTGIAGFALFAYCISYYIRKVVKYIAKEDMAYVLSSFVGLIILLSVNTGLFPAVGMMAFTTAPLILKKKDNGIPRYV